MSSENHQKQQILDLKAGTILRENVRKTNLFYGCPIGVLLILIVLVKCTLVSIWILKEYDSFDFQCSSWESEETSFLRTKRWTLFSNSDPRTVESSKLAGNLDEQEVVLNESKNRKPIYASSRRSLDGTTKDSPKIDPKLDLGPLPPSFVNHRAISNNVIDEEEEEEDDELPLSTMVTLTNTQIVPLKGQDQGIVKMKTIRNRVEKVGSDEEQFIEIEIANAPRIYVSKIKSRHGGDNEDELPDFDLLKDLKKEKKLKKNKGRGLKKARKMKMAEEELKNGTKIEKGRNNKKKHKNRHKNKDRKENEIPNLTEITKSPRHLMSGAASTSDKMQTTTPRSHKSSWINGVIDPDDPNFSNQGEIRGFPMQKASKKPKPVKQVAATSKPMSEEKKSSMEQIKLSDNTRMMWEMNEIKYTTFLAPKTTEVSKIINDEQVSSEEAGPSTTTQTPKLLKNVSESSKYEPPRKFQYDTKSPNPDENVASSVHISGIPVSFTPTTHMPPHLIGNSFASASDSPYYVEVNDADTETVYIKDVTPIYRNLFADRPETTTKPYDPQHFDNELLKLRNSSICMARMAFDIWCLFVLFSSVPFILGICVPRWSLFVLHIVFDFLFLVVGFVSSLTIAIMSSIMYFLIDEMSSDSLFEFLLVSFVIDIILILYSLIVILTYKCCSRAIENSIKDENFNHFATNGEQV